MSNTEEQHVHACRYGPHMGGWASGCVCLCGAKQAATGLDWQEPVSTVPEFDLAGYRADLQRRVTFLSGALNEVDIAETTRLRLMGKRAAFEIAIQLLPKEDQ